MNPMPWCLLHDFPVTWLMLAQERRRQVHHGRVQSASPPFQTFHSFCTQHKILRQLYDKFSSEIGEWNRDRDGLGCL